jgi:hypothetical protein
LDDSDCKGSRPSLAPIGGAPSGMMLSLRHPGVSNIGKLFNDAMTIVNFFAMLALTI